MDYLVTSRPTAVNLADAAEKLKTLAKANGSMDAEALRDLVVGACERMMEEDIAANKRMGQVGMEAVIKATQVTVYTGLGIAVYRKSEHLGKQWNDHLATLPPSAIDQLQLA